MLQPPPIVIDKTAPASEAPEGAIPVALYGELGGGEGLDSDTAIGRAILQVEGSTDLATIPDFAKYSYIDMRGERTSTQTYLDLPRAEDYGEGRILYVNDKLGNVDPDSWRTRIAVRAATGQGIDGSGTRTITEKNGFLALRATKPGPISKQEWQVVGTNSPMHHTNPGFANWHTSDMEVGKGYTNNWYGAHVYVPLSLEVYRTDAVNKFWVRYYPTRAMAEQDKDRVYGTQVPAGVQVMNEFVVGGDAPVKSYGTGGVVSSWDANGNPDNSYFTAVTLIEGTPGSLAMYSVYKDMVTLPS